MSQDMLEEDVKLSLQYHKQMNPKLWSSDKKLRAEVRSKLLQFAKTWQTFAGIPNDSVVDIILTGGNANYNYTRFSDLDVHLLVDKSKLTMFGAKLDDQMQAKKQLWTLTHDVKVLGYALEPYAQDKDSKFPRGQGVYSLKNERWLQEPIYQQNLTFRNDPILKQKVEHYMDLIDSIIKHHMGQSAIDSLKTRLKTMRNAAIAKGGEFSRENLVFKELRNQGYLDKLNDYEKSEQDKKLSLK